MASETHALHGTVGFRIDEVSTPGDLFVGPIARTAAECRGYKARGRSFPRIAERERAEREERPGRWIGDDGGEASGGVEFDRHIDCVEIQEGAGVAAGDVEDRRAIAVFTLSTAACNWSKRCSPGPHNSTKSGPFLSGKT